MVHLLLGHAVVEGRDGDITAVFDGGPVAVGIDAGAGVEAGAGHLAGAGGADGAGAEAGAFFFFFLSVIFIYMSVCVYICWHTRSVANGGIKRSADNGDIETFIGLD